MVNRKLKSFFKTHERILILSVALLLLVAGIWVVRVRNQSGKNGGNTSGDSSSANQNSSSNAEKAETNTHKEQISQPPAATTPSPNSKKSVTPIITYASQEQVNAYVPGVFEEGGTCKATLTKGSTVVTKTSVGFGNVSYTSCAPIDVSGLLTETGTWNLVVSYGSATAEGSSVARTLEVK